MMSCGGVRRPGELVTFGRQVAAASAAHILLREARAFPRGRTLLADGIYLRRLDTPVELTLGDPFRQVREADLSGLEAEKAR